MVDVSPSIVMQLNERRPPARPARRSTGGATTASVARKPSMVAMFGRIMPAPLLMPVTRDRLAADRDLARSGLGHGVGGHDRLRPASHQLASLQFASAAGRPAFDAIDRQRLHDHAGRKRQHLLRRDVQRARERDAGFARAAPARRLAGAGIRVAGVDHHRANRLAAARTRSRCSRHTCTGAAQKRFCVNTPPTVAPSSTEMTSTSLRFGLRISPPPSRA